MTSLAGYNGVRFHISFAGVEKVATLQSVREQVRTAIAEGDYDRGLSAVEVIRRHFPSDFETTGLLGQIHLGCGRRTEARDAFESVLQIDPENVVALSGLALLTEEEGDLDRALELFERAFDLDTSNHPVAGEIGRLHSLLSHTRPVDPGSSQHAVARRLLREKRYDRATALFEDALRRSAELPEVVVGMAQVLWLAGRFEEAEEVANEILAEHPHCLKVLAILAGAAFSRMEQEALSLLRKTSELDPGNSIARRLFVEVGLPFPKVGEEPEIPAVELQGVVELVRRAEPPAKDESVLEEAEDQEWEDEREEHEEAEPLELPDAQLEGEWVRGRGEAASAVAEADPTDLKAHWLAGDALVAEGKFRQAVEQYLAVLNSSRGISPLVEGAVGDGVSTVKREKDGTNSGDRQA